MKSIMISIQPQWVEKILNGEKTIEIRKTIPKCELPCKVYIYCTKSKPYLYRLNDDDDFELTNQLKFQEDGFVKDYNAQNGKVVAEFTLNQADEFSVFESGSVQYWNCYNLEKSCLTYEQIAKYIGYDKKYGYRNGYAWFIDNLKIYDKPKDLSEFKHWVIDCNGWCNEKNKKENLYVLENIERPPQSWCYVEENKNGI